MLAFSGCSRPILEGLRWEALMAVASNSQVAVSGWSLVVILSLSSCVLAQEPSPVIQGGWAATVGVTRVFRGTWRCQPSPDKPNMVQGS